MKTTILLTLTFALLTGWAVAQPAKIDSGTINGARYKIMFPPNWKNKLVMYAHGYEFMHSPSAIDNPNFAQRMAPFLERGYAVAASAYRQQGYALPEGIEDTEALRNHFVTKYGKPDTTYMAGESMGGGVSLGTMENFAANYQGALPLCPLSSRPYIQTRKEFDLLAVFNVLFPGLTSSLSDIVNNSANTQPQPMNQVFAKVPPIQNGLMKDSLAAMQLARLFDLKLKDLPFAVLFGEMVLRDLIRKSGGNPFDNTNTLYSGFPDDWMVNQKVERFAASRKSYDYLQRYDRTGDIARPVVILHTTYDQLIPAELAVTNYENMVRQRNKEQFMVVKYTNGQGHCQFTPRQTGTAFDTLRQWVSTGKRPQPGPIE
ncbi:S9 family peptidase [Telluribacter sp. SYSU D00476]|uniref:alpha/beta hydrolase family protein n=1 Tax=Telluribacter sp. SYSU D00476 TaxID=2811430 RepID=UPI001FF63B2E|nr:alpha/beta hydrolase [Telluribacter sp. SYSU D00476]